MKIFSLPPSSSFLSVLLVAVVAGAITKSGMEETTTTLKHVFAQARNLQETNNPLYSWVESTWFTIQSLFQFSCPESWTLGTTLKFGLDAATLSVSSVSETAAATSVALIEFYLTEIEDSGEIGICEFETTSFDFVSLGNTDTSANTIELNVDWTISQELCGTESAVHAALKALNWDTVIALWKAYGVQQGDQFVGAISSMSYTCPRDDQCDGTTGCFTFAGANKQPIDTINGL